MTFVELFAAIAVLAIIGAIAWSWRDRVNSADPFPDTQKDDAPDQEAQRDGGPKIRV